MIIPDSRKTASLIVAGLKPKSGEMSAMDKPLKSPEKEEDPDKEGLKAIAEEIMQAFEQKDAHSLAVGLHDFFEMCKSMNDDDGEDEEDKPMESGDQNPGMPSLF